MDVFFIPSSRNLFDSPISIFAHLSLGNPKIPELIAGIGVSGDGSDAGVFGNGVKYGGDFIGGLAPLRLRPSKIQGSPNTGDHSMGELYVDNEGALYFCVVSGTPGTWKRVQLV